MGSYSHTEEEGVAAQTKAGTDETRPRYSVPISGV